MFVVNDYATAVILCIVTMLCWGSWGNTQKLAGRTWRYELFYWDYVVGMLLFSLILCFTLGSIGSEGRPFLEDLAQAAPKALGSVLLGGVIFNASNILLSASVSLAGLAVAFPLGVGLALVLGVVINYLGAPKGDPVILFLGVALIVLLIALNVKPKPKDPAVAVTPSVTATAEPSAAPTETPVPTPTPSPKPTEKPASGGYILPDSATRRLTQADVADLTWEQCCLARNEIFARHGRIFQTPQIAAYFEAQSWYHGTVPGASFDNNSLTPTERANADFLADYETTTWGHSYY